jgi:ATP-binding cassette subfamily B multidrug efflux pump
VLDTELSIRDLEQPKTLGDAAGDLVFDDVSFRYGNAEEDTLSHISFTAKRGETTAFIGATGAGKSTLVNLIPRFYDVTAGAVRLNGKDVRDVRQAELRERSATCRRRACCSPAQSPRTSATAGRTPTNRPCWKRSIARRPANSSPSCPAAPKTRSRRAARTSPAGRSSALRLRGRWCAKRRSISSTTAFPRSTSGPTQSCAARSHRYTKDSIVLIVAQRVSTILNAEQIIVLDEGRIVGKGTHRELLETCPTYREIAESQLSKEELA